MSNKFGIVAFLFGVLLITSPQVFAIDVKTHLYVTNASDSGIIIDGTTSVGPAKTGFYVSIPHSNGRSELRGTFADTAYFLSSDEYRHSILVKEGGNIICSAKENLTVFLRGFSARYENLNAEGVNNDRCRWYWEKYDDSIKIVLHIFARHGA